MFGLEVTGLPDLPASSDPPPAGCSRAVNIQVVGAAEIAARWRPSKPHRIAERRLPDGRLVFAVDDEPGVAYRVHAPAVATHLVSADGSEVLIPEDDGPAWQWQRLLFSQTLSIAATLQGLDLFHASAVRIGDYAVAIAAQSGTGKTSTAAHLVAHGAGFVTDDVLALDSLEGGVVAFAGPEFFSIEEHEVRAVDPGRRVRLGPLLGECGKQYFRPTVAQTSLPLGVLYLLERHSEAEAVEVNAFDGSSVGTLLASAFMPHLSSDERLVTHLDLCGQMASADQIYRLRAPLRGSAAAVAVVVMEHARRRLS